MCRSAVRIFSNCAPEDTITDQKAKQEGEVREHSDYYNVIPGKTPPTGGIEDLRITREENKQDPSEIHRVRVQHEDGLLSSQQFDLIKSNHIISLFCGQHNSFFIAN